MAEERVAVLEANIDHIKSDVSETKAEVKRLSAKIDAVDEKLTTKIDAVDEKLTAKIGGVGDKLTAKIDTLDEKLYEFKVSSAKSFGELKASMERGFGELGVRIAELGTHTEKSLGKLNVGRALDRVWWLLISAALLGVMAKGFKWL